MPAHRRLRSGGLEWRAIEDEVIAVDVPEATYLGTNAAGALLWQELAQGADMDRLASVLVEAYGVEAEEARTDVAAFLEQLEQAGLLEGE